MQDASNFITEAELGKLIVHMHDNLGMGFRKISKAPKTRGIHNVGEDRANRLYWEYKALGNGDAEEKDDELIRLSKMEKDVVKMVETAKSKKEKKWRIKTMLIQEAEASFERRREIFLYKNAVHDFAQLVIKLENPALWLRLEEECEEANIDLADALQDALGSQVDYEQGRLESSEGEGEYFLDEYLCSCIESWLLEQKRKWFEKMNAEDEFVTIQIPASE